MSPGQQRKRSPVIKDVAKLAGVSVPTVSRYLNKTAAVSLEKTQRIAKAIELLDYRPSPIARALVKESLRAVAVFTGDTTLFGSVMTLSGIETAASQARYLVSITALDTLDRAEIPATIALALDQNPAGIIVLQFDAAGDEATRWIPPTTPAVLIAGQREETRDQITLCEDEGGYEVTQYLLSLGHRTVHHVSLPRSASGGSNRTAGWRRALKEAGAPTPEPIEATWDPESGRLIGHDLGRRNDVTAVFVGNDEIALGVIRGLTEVGKSVPDDVSVAGFDCNPLSALTNPAITTYRQDFTKAGSLAWAMLHEQLKGSREPRLLKVEGTLVARESAAPPNRSR